MSKLLKNKLMNTGVVLLSALIFTLYTLPIQAAGIGVSPQSIQVSQSEFDLTEVELAIHNTGDQPTIYLVEADKWPQLISTTTPKFRLEPAEARVVKVVFERIPTGNHKTFISIVAQEVGTRATQPKTGIKIPVSLEIIPVNAVYSERFTPLLLSLILVSLAFLLLAAFRQRQMSTFRKVQDIIQERYAKRSMPKRIKHYLKHHALLVISGIAIILTAVLLMWSFLTPPESTVLQNYSPQLTEATGNNVSIEVQSPAETKVYSLDVGKNSYSAFTALQKIAERYTIPLTYDPPNELGVFVTQFSGFTNGEGGKYWLFEVNNQRIPVAADKYIVKAGDKLVWKFTRPD